MLHGKVRLRRVGQKTGGQFKSGTVFAFICVIAYFVFLVLACVVCCLVFGIGMCSICGISWVGLCSTGGAVTSTFTPRRAISCSCVAGMCGVLVVVSLFRLGGSGCPA